ncbi:hypothetical protein C349_03986 [Cryptococcus neoformans var. grubii Br795]|uniref:Uncharacterized protein n=1 Tax=Cryptococcus neoformans Tu259-1 TaxID=1230072 RepID=A0A854QF97_CRYNE|nr:hypothetical protein C361_04264 [Cryptococcus neoformans var. grubii Tu259-1]OXG31381.1 hypothetical protein C360_04588 [Cryptococcus neoformans var. grubii Bt15]OXG49081.1 hypothetical protein C355_03768 [Cryptococcus neoformans var. grubii Th84]OXG78959.1 hypothetical protein C350_03844 [Cryptococcus neoformans var. grubii MW-RSA36]OXG80797.1 hypothetical protein C349_03986 [Cryptococcus neoformans var. grubii Br795]OXH08957.1 hypothetical protein J010_03872 [Cryptococcus neoformans var. 
MLNNNKDQTPSPFPSSFPYQPFTSPTSTSTASVDALDLSLPDTIDIALSPSPKIVPQEPGADSLFKTPSRPTTSTPKSKAHTVYPIRRSALKQTKNILEGAKRQDGMTEEDKKELWVALVGSQLGASLLMAVEGEDEHDEEETVDETPKVHDDGKDSRVSIIQFKTTSPLATKTNSQALQAQMEGHQLGKHIAHAEPRDFAAPIFELMISTTATVVATPVEPDKPRAQSSTSSEATLGEYFYAALPVTQNSVHVNNVVSEVRDAPAVPNIPEAPIASLDGDMERAQSRRTERQTIFGRIDQALIFFVMGFLAPPAWVIGGWFCSSALNTYDSFDASTDSFSVVVIVPTLPNATSTCHASSSGSDSPAPPAWPAIGTVSESELCVPSKRRNKWFQHKNGWVRACRWAVVIATSVIVTAGVVTPLTFVGV